MTTRISTALGRLAAGVAHELKNPLAVVVGRVELLRQAVDAGRVPPAEMLGRSTAAMRDAAERMTRIVQGLSTYSKPPRPEPTHLDVRELLSATRQLIGYQARKVGVTLVVEAAEIVPGVNGDRSQMMQMLLNLANNAIEAMAATGGRLTLRARVEAGSVAIEVEETGSGIGAGALEKIWEAFYTTKPEGTGLGLSIVRALVADLPGATIGVASTPGQGTRFTITMRAADP